MSLLSGMNDMLTNSIALEEAEEALVLEENYALEADEFIDVIADGKDSDDDIDEMEEEDEIEDQINKELDSEEEFSANESVALTGNNFLDHLLLNDNDPITTKDGSVGQTDSAANFDLNFSDGLDNDNDPIITGDGSVGQKDSSTSELTVESALFYEDFLGENIATESIVSKVKDANNNRKLKRRQNMLKLAGMTSDINMTEINELLNQKQFDKAKYKVASFGKKLEALKDKMPSDDHSDKKIKAINNLIKTNTALLIRIEEKKKTSQNIKRGMDEKMAKRAARNVIKNNAKKASVVTEAAINDAYSVIDSFDPVEVEETKDGSVGQGDSMANFDNNFSRGFFNTEDDIKIHTNDSAANFDLNFSDGLDNDNDPIITGDGSVGQKDSTANGQECITKNPANESTVDDELMLMNELLLDDFYDDLSE